MLSHFQKISASIAALVIVTCLTFSPCLFNQFTLWDDPQMLTKNPLVTDLSGPGIIKTFRSFTNGSYVPLTILSYSIEYHFFQYNPMIYHATNLILHLINVLLVFWLLMILTKNNTVSLLSTLLFAINPLRVESVAWVSERKDVLFVLFLLASLISYTLYVVKERKQTALYLLSLLLFILSSFSKPQAFILPFLLINLDFFLDPKSWKDHIASKIPFFIISAVFISIGRLSLSPLISGQTYYETFNTLDKSILTAHSVIFYITQSLLPFFTSCVYPYPAKASHGFPLMTYISPAILAIIVSYIVYKLRTDNIMLFALWFFLITLFPPLLNIWLGGYFAADRYMYLPHIGLSLGLVHLTILKFQKKFRLFNQWNILLFSIYILFLCILSAGKCFVWKNDLTLWGNAIEIFPEMPISYLNRAAKYMYLRDPVQALKDLNRCLQLDPKYIDAYFNRALIYTDIGKLDLAIQDNTTVIALDSKQLEAYNNRGYCYFKLNQFNPGINDFNVVLALDPTNQKALLNRAYCYAELKNFIKAKDDLQKLLKIDPNHPAANETLEKIRKLG